MSVVRTEPLKAILIVTLIGSITLETLLVISIILGSASSFPRAIAGISAVLYLLISIAIFHRQHTTAAAWMITAFYFVIGSATAFVWGINAPVGILLLSFSLLLSALLLPIKYIFINTSAVILTLLANQLMVGYGALNPNTTGLSATSTFIDLFIYTIIYSMFAVLTWLIASKIKHAFDELAHSKEVIERQNKRISKELEVEKKRLRLTEISKTSQLAEFSEIGQYTSLLMHDLSNELAILKMRDQTNNSSDFDETSKIIDEIERVIQRSRRALSNKHEAKHIRSILSEVAKNFQYYSSISNVNMNIEIPEQDKNVKNAHLVHQVLSVIIKNAIDAYATQSSFEKREVHIISRATRNKLIISIKDWAGGIPGYKDSRVFDGVRSTKKNGHGLGLHLCRIIVTEQLNGTINYKKSPGSSEFTITLPIA